MIKRENQSIQQLISSLNESERSIQLKNVKILYQKLINDEVSISEKVILEKVLIQNLKTKDEIFLQEIIKLLGFFNSNVTINKLLTLLNNESPLTQLNSIKFLRFKLSNNKLSKSEKDVLENELLIKLETNYTSILLETLYAFILLKSKKALQQLMELFKNENSLAQRNPLIKPNLIVAIGVINDPIVLEFLLDLLENNKTIHRSTIVTLMGQIDSIQLIPSLVAVVMNDEEDCATKRYAARSLSNSKHEEALKQFINCYKELILRKKEKLSITEINCCLILKKIKNLVFEGESIILATMFFDLLLDKNKIISKVTKKLLDDPSGTYILIHEEYFEVISYYIDCYLETKFKMLNNDDQKYLLQCFLELRLENEQISKLRLLLKEIRNRKIINKITTKL